MLGAPAFAGPFWSDRWAIYSERRGNSFGPNGFSIGSRRHVSSSKYPQIVLHKVTPDVVADLRHADALAREHILRFTLRPCGSEGTGSPTQKHPGMSYPNSSILGTDA